MNVFRPRWTKRVVCQLNSTPVVLEYSRHVPLIPMRHKAKDTPKEEDFLNALGKRNMLRLA